MSVRCGNHPRTETLRGGAIVYTLPTYHGSAASVRTCYSNPDAFTCGWLMDGGRNEDGGRVEVACQGIAISDDRGWKCEHGHDYVNMETRYNEGWDYASDPEEAAQLRKYGTEAVAMDGTGI